MAGPLEIFVYGTLRPGGWNHEQWLVPLLAAPCRPGRLLGMALHHHEGLPALVPAAADSVVIGDVATIKSEGYDESLAMLDFLESTATDHYRRVAVTTDAGADVWVWVAGDRLSGELGEHSLVPHGDWLRVPGAVR